MEKLPTIPSPWSATLRRWRINIGPLVAFVLVLFVVIWLWGKSEGGSAPGLAEGLRSTLTCPQPAFLQELNVQPYQWVEAGQALGTLRPMDARARLDFLQAELQVARLRMEPSLLDRNALDFERLRVEGLRFREELAVAEVELHRAETALSRNAILRAEKLVSADTYELSLRDRDRYQAETFEKRKAIELIDARLIALGPVAPVLSATNESVQALMERLDVSLIEAETNLHPITLLAPISGMVQMVYRQPGEFVPEGDPLITINAAKSDRIVGYLRQPYPMEPKVGMKVEVRARSRARELFLSKVSQIGAQVEVITNALAVLRPFALMDVGLPFVVEVPRGVNIRPGEAFDIRFLQDPEGPRTPTK
jgi:multidrug resistance efflux pump